MSYPTYTIHSATHGWRVPDINEGTDDKYPSIEQVFTNRDAPGLANQPRYLHATLSADVDYRDVRGNPRSGGLYRVAFGIWDDTSLEQYNFRRFDLSLRQFMPLGSEKAHVVSGTFGVSYVNNAPGDRVPFGVRVHRRRQTFARINIATGGGEGWKVFLKLGPRPLAR